MPGDLLGGGGVRWTRHVCLVEHSQEHLFARWREARQSRGAASFKSTKEIGNRSPSTQLGADQVGDVRRVCHIRGNPRFPFLIRFGTRDSLQDGFGEDASHTVPIRVRKHCNDASCARRNAGGFRPPHVSEIRFRSRCQDLSILFKDFSNPDALIKVKGHFMLWWFLAPIVRNLADVHVQWFRLLSRSGDVAVSHQL